MGLRFSSLAKLLFSPVEKRIVMIGLDAAGKTSILFKLKLGELVTTIPTIGTPEEKIQHFQEFVLTIPFLRQDLMSKRFSTRV